MTAGVNKSGLATDNAPIVTTRMGGPPWPPLSTCAARRTEEGRPRRAAHTGRYYVGSPAFNHTLRPETTTKTVGQD